VVVLNGEIVDTGCDSDAECDDGNACTTDTCNADGSCSNGGVSCDDGNACTLDSCDAVSGCYSETITCNDGNNCTTDSCDPAVGCSTAPVSCDDGNDCTIDTCNAADGSCTNVDQCPDCSGAGPSVATLWPPNHKFRNVNVVGVTDPQGQSTTITIDGIFQDEPTNSIGDGETCPDASGVGGSTASLRAERQGTEDGRVYFIAFTAVDSDGYWCSGEVTSCVPHDMGAGSVCVDDGPDYDSMICTP
jgi:hypothetical protein